MRIARMQAKVGDVMPFELAPDYADIRVSVPIKGTRGLEVALISDLEFAEQLAMARAGSRLRILIQRWWRTESVSS